MIRSIGHAGVLVGAAAVWMANRYKLISLPADVYSISEVPLTFQFRDVLLAAACVTEPTVDLLAQAKARARDFIDELPAGSKICQLIIEKIATLRKNCIESRKLHEHISVH